MHYALIDYAVDNCCRYYSDTDFRFKDLKNMYVII